MRTLLLLLAWIPFFVGAQRNDEKNILCDASNRNGHYIFYGKQRPELGYPPEGKVEEGNYVNDRKEGFWTKYFNDGITPKLIGMYVNNRPNGSYKKYYPSGALKETGSIHRNQYRDSLVRYYENGKREYTAYFDSVGKEQGLVRYWLPDGKLELEYTAENGTVSNISRKVLHGGGYRYYDQEKNSSPEDRVQIKLIGDPKDPNTTEKAPFPGSNPRTHGAKWLPNGYNKVYNEDDEIWQDGTFKEGKLWDGKLYVFDSDGILLRVKIFKGGIYHSDGQI